MTHSLIGADRNTHFKTIIVSAIAAIAFACAGIARRPSDAKDRTGQLGERDVREAVFQQ
jgi:hypothetical protein